MRTGRFIFLRRGLILAAVMLGSLAFAGVASAATFTVNDTRDLAQSGTASPGTCVSTASTCTLRAAMQAANQNGGATTINLPAGTYPITTKTSATPGCDGNTGSDETTGGYKVNPCNNSTQVTVIGAGSGKTVINAQGNGRIFLVYANGSLDVQKMTLENGLEDGSSTHDPFNTQAGAIGSTGHLTVEDTVFTGNAATLAGGAVVAGPQSGSTMSITGSTFQNNSASIGGAVATVAPNDVSISFSLFQSNTAPTDGKLPGNGGAGGAVAGCEASICGADSAGMTLNFDDFTQNVSQGIGGGALGWGGAGALTVTNSLFSQNQAQNSSATPSEGAGGAIGIARIDGKGHSIVGAGATISNTSFDGNSAAGPQGGGALYDQSSNALNLTQDRWTGNTAAGAHGGGALYLNSHDATSGNYGGITTITSNEFDGNSATTANGGAIDWEYGPLSLLGSSFVKNTATNGGALYANVPVDSPTPGMGHGGLLTVVDSTLSRNTASGSGGAIDNAIPAGLTATHSSLTNDTIAFNNASATNGGGIFGADAFASGGSQGSGFGVENTTVAENSGGDCNAKFAGSFDVGNNNDSDQTCFGGVGGPNDKTGVNPLLSNPADNGGPLAGGPGDTITVQTDAEQSGSPTVNAGNNNGCPSVDERGVTRPQGSACDIGAFEFGANPTSTTSTSTLRPPPPITTTTTTPKTRCPKGKHRSHGKCVKNKKHRKHRCPKGKVRKGKKCVKHTTHKKGKKR